MLATGAVKLLAGLPFQPQIHSHSNPIKLHIDHYEGDDQVTRYSVDGIIT